MIGQATGILVARHEVSCDEAFALVREQSTQQIRRLRSIAAEIVEVHDQQRST